jgi:hypothetical protein
MAIVASTSPIDTPVDHALYAALVAVQDSFLSNDPQFPSQLSLAAANNPYSLYYGKIEHDPDRHLFEKDMQSKTF